MVHHDLHILNILKIRDEDKIVHLTVEDSEQLH